MSPIEFKRRTFEYGARIVRLVQALPKIDATQALGRQLLRSGTSVGANYTEILSMIVSSIATARTRGKALRARRNYAILSKSK